MRLSILGLACIAVSIGLAALEFYFGGNGAALWSAAAAFIGGATLIVRGLLGKPDHDDERR